MTYFLTEVKLSAVEEETLLTQPIPEWGSVLEYAAEKFRTKRFMPHEHIAMNEKFIYLPISGYVRLECGSLKEEHRSVVGIKPKAAPFLGIKNRGVPFHCVASAAGAEVMFLYEEELNQWPAFAEYCMSYLQEDYRRQMLWLGNLGQRRAMNRLEGFISLLSLETGIFTEEGTCKEGYAYIPFAITHAEIGNCIGATRVTVTRNLGELRGLGKIHVNDAGCIGYKHNVGADNWSI